MIWLGYFSSDEPVNMEYFFFYCDKNNKEVDLNIEFTNDGIEEFLSKNDMYISVEEWKSDFKINDPIFPTRLKKLPTSVKKFKQLCRELMPEVFL